MKKTMIILFLLTAVYVNCSAQLYFTKNGNISFFSTTPMEDIKADNNQVISIINSNGEIQFSLLTNAFHFKKALMEEHFNADYIESEKYPKATFKGSFSNPGAVNFSKDGTYNITVSGSLQIHGVTNNVSVPGKITISAGQVSAFAKFKIKVKDYNISIPAVVKNNIAETVELTINCSYEKK